MKYSDIKINDQITARIYYNKFGRQIYLVDNEGNEIAEVRPLGVDLGSFLRYPKDGGEDNGARDKI